LTPTDCMDVPAGPSAGACTELRAVDHRKLGVVHP